MHVFLKNSVAFKERLLYSELRYFRCTKDVGGHCPFWPRREL